MPSDPHTARRVREAASGYGFDERFFFGGDAWFLHGHFAVGVYHDRLTLRLGPDAAGAAIDAQRATPMDITGRPMKGWVFVDPASFATRAKLAGWIDQAHGFVSSLPPKKPAASKRKTKK